MWKITRILDKGPQEHYRFHVRGINQSTEIDKEFSWSVPDLDDARYYLADGVDNQTQESFMRARDPKASKRR